MATAVKVDDATKARLDQLQAQMTLALGRKPTLQELLDRLSELGWAERERLARALGGTWKPLTDTRTRSHLKADRLAAFLLGEEPFEEAFEVVPVDNGIFRDARRIFHRHANKRLSFTDCTSVALVEARGMRGIATLDTGFDG